MRQGNPNPRPASLKGGEATRLKWATIRAAKQVLCLEVVDAAALTAKATAAELNARGVKTPSGAAAWTEDTVHDLWRVRK